MRKYLIVALSLAIPFLAVAQKKKKNPTKPEIVENAPIEKKADPETGQFIKLSSGLEYRIYKHGTGTRHPQVSDHIEMNIRVHVKDSVMFDSRKMNNNKCVPFQVQKPNFKGDPIEGFMQLVAGDSAVLRLPVDSLIKNTGQAMPGMNPGDMLEYEIAMVSVMSDEEYRKDMAMKIEVQKAIDEKTLTEYFGKNNIKAMRTASGLYYSISKEGKGETLKKGMMVSVNYTGKLIDGKPFDSNTDPQFQHLEPFTVELGMGRVIPGWDEGLALLKVGSKATLYIPSGLAYGPQDKSPTIPPNSILIFDVEIVKAENQKDKDDVLIKDYLAKKKIKATKTASGLYYVITKPGTGDAPAPGAKVSVNYTGKTLDGKKFDSNVDTAFHHVQPFEFPLGQGNVIKGWDEGIGLLKKGAKATLFIPSGMAYGAQSPTPAIPPNSVLIFDVELKDINK
ncbi:MAG: hypothetical protein EBX41_02870 [Chitinophagia bacterium]|nr:hypothetical protein [Chitinophagia bacterium]